MPPKSPFLSLDFCATLYQNKVANETVAERHKSYNVINAVY